MTLEAAVLARQGWEKTTVQIDGGQTVGSSQLSAVSESGIDSQDGWDHAAGPVRNSKKQ